MSIFDNASNVTINNKDVASISIDGNFIYKKEETIMNEMSILFTVRSGVCIFKLQATFPSDCDVDWGDGTVGKITDFTDRGEVIHDYDTTGTYTIKVTGDFTSIPYGFGLGASSSNSDTDITLSEGITTLEDEAFNDWRLNSITFGSTVPPKIGSRSLSSYNSSLTLKVPRGSLNAYRSAFDPYTPYGHTFNYVEY